MQAINPENEVCHFVMEVGQDRLLITDTQLQVCYAMKAEEIKRPAHLQWHRVVFVAMQRIQSLCSDQTLLQIKHLH